MFADLAPWTHQWLAWLAVALEDIRMYKNHQNLVRRIKNPLLYPEGLSVLQVAHQLTSTGFHCSVEPSVQVGERVRKPDLMLQDQETGHRIYVEVTRLLTSEEAREADTCFRSINYTLLRYSPWLKSSGRIHKILNGGDLERAIQLVTRSCEVARARGALQEISDLDLEIAVCGNQEASKLAAWSQARGLEVNALQGPPYEFSDLGRVLRKAAEKQSQVPGDWPALIVIWTAKVFLASSQIEDVLAVLDRAQHLLGHVYGVLILGEWLGVGKAEVKELHDHVYVSNTRHGILQGRALFVSNKNRTVAIPPGTEKSLRAAIMGGRAGGTN